MNLHPTAIIDASAQLGEGVDVGPYAVIGADVVVGPGTVIGPHAVIHRYTTLGARCQVHAHTSIGDTPQDLSFRDAVTYTRIGDGVVLREGVTIHRGTKEGTTTELGDGCFLMANSHVAHNATLGKNVILANGVLLAGYVEIGDKAFLSGNAMVHQFCRVGRLAMLSGGMGASCDVPPFCTTMMLSRNELVGLNTIGLRRNGFSAEERLALRAAFHTLFRSSLLLRDAVKLLQDAHAAGPVRELADFIAASKRGVCKVGRGSRSAPDQDDPLD